MTDWRALQSDAARRHAEALPAVTDWAASAPCGSWTARDVLAHVVDEQMWIPGLLAGGSTEEVGDDLEDRLRRLREKSSGPELIEEWRTARDSVAAAWRGPSDGDQGAPPYGQARVGHQPD